MLTNIDIDAALTAKAMQLTGLRTKKEVVHAALLALVQQYDQREVRDLRGRLRWEGGETAKGRS